MPDKTIYGKKDSEKKYRSIFENSIVGFFQSTPEGKFIEANPALASFLGYLSPEDLISYVSDISTQLYAMPEERKRYQKILQEKGRVDGLEFKARCKDGSVKWLSESTIAYFNPDGTPFRYEGVLSDINDKKLAEEKLKESEAQHYSIIQTAMDGFWLMDHAGCLLEVNETYCRMSGYTKEELLSMNVQDIEALQTEDEIDNRLAGLLDYREDRFESQHRRKDGTIFDTEISIQYWSRKKNQFVVFIRDITEKKQNEKKLQMVHEKFLTVLDSIDVTIYVADIKTYTILFMNKHMIESFGRDMTGEICFEAFRKMSEPCAFCTNDQLVDKNGSPAGVCIWQNENPITKKFYINRDRAIEWTDGRLVRLQVATDITEHKQAAEALLEQERLQGVLEMAGAICHELNQPLQTVLGFSELILMDIKAEDPLYKPLKGIETGIDRIAALMRKIMGITRYQAKPYLKTKIVDIEKASQKDQA